MSRSPSSAGLSYRSLYSVYQAYDPARVGCMADTADRRAGKADSDTAADTAVRMVRMAADSAFPLY